ncbi:TonB-dependent siderophore receptor [Cellvibrio japonicus]|uniref:TonB-dependent receptor n=1 Tax=Cellvibrio japonicus (strain Ueda107) TaxID=498211 RepID=B3PCJ1_CELJU|nr:TonB-dependent siderophore receptor [Cellvibrio japonicus]ACE83809.1 TonB-dependent receptor [Cellvibrio japonicus Ueda107]QEI11893.1 TonB-dependent siderophore receptor [Cellvibrio japonicus]QEI15467.1 TonB-dependent siderophore receptor [Cellvibrio japonicus]QEI19046.1 TonB-dependent siderophore receptor [Cellvibrio japonicus]
MRFQSHLLAGLIASLTAGISCAQTTETESGKLKAVKVEASALGSTTEQTGAYTTGNMSTATKMDLSIRETPQSVSVITSAQMEDLNLFTINDALDTATGVNVKRSETDRTYFEARGFDINNFQVDGVGIPLHWDLLEGDIDMAVYDRVEIVRGASGLMSGLGSPAATVNLVRKRPTADTQASASITHARWDDTRGVADVSGALGSAVRARVVASEQSRDSYLQDYHKDLSSTYGVIEADLGTDTLLTAGISRQKSEADSPMWGGLTLSYEANNGETRPTHFRRSMSSSADWAYWDVKDTRSFVELNHTWSNSWETKATYNRTKTRGAQELLYVYGTLLEDMSGLGGWAGKFNRETDLKLFDITTSGEFSTGDLTHKFVAGFNRADSDLHERAFYDYTTGNGFPVINNMAEWTGDTPHPSFTNEDPGEITNDTQTGIYLAGQFSLTSRLKLLTGARAASYESNSTSYGTNLSKDDDVVVPYAGLTYDLSQQLTLYTSYTETFTPQSEAKLSGERLDPATGVNKELGIKGEFLEGKLNTTFAVFETAQENLATHAGFNNNASLGPIGDYYIGDDYVSRGFEFEIAGQVNEQLNVVLGYTNLTIDDNDGEVARTFTPKQSVKLTVNYNPLWLPGLTLGSFVEYRSDTYLRNNSAVKQDALTLLDAFASYDINKNLSVALNLGNITDETYLTSFEYGQAYYAEPRNISATLRWRY